MLKVFMCFHVKGLWSEPSAGWGVIEGYPKTTSICPKPARGWYALSWSNWWPVGWRF